MALFKPTWQSDNKEKALKYIRVMYSLKEVPDKFDETLRRIASDAPLTETRKAAEEIIQITDALSHELNPSFLGSKGAELRVADEKWWNDSSNVQKGSIVFIVDADSFIDLSYKQDRLRLENGRIYFNFNRIVPARCQPADYTSAEYAIFFRKFFEGAGGFYLDSNSHFQGTPVIQCIEVWLVRRSDKERVKGYVIRGSDPPQTVAFGMADYSIGKVIPGSEPRFDIITCSIMKLIEMISPII